MTASATEQELWDRLDALVAERDKLLTVTAQLEADKEALCVQRNKCNAEAAKLATKINNLIFPRMSVIAKDIALLSAALSGRDRPAKAPADGRL